jgi:hypothetical protein
VIGDEITVADADDGRDLAQLALLHRPLVGRRTRGKRKIACRLAPSNDLIANSIEFLSNDGAAIAASTHIRLTLSPTEP